MWGWEAFPFVLKYMINKLDPILQFLHVFQYLSAKHWSFLFFLCNFKWLHIRVCLNLWTRWTEGLSAATLRPILPSTFYPRCFFLFFHGTAIKRALSSAVYVRAAALCVRLLSQATAHNLTYTRRGYATVGIINPLHSPKIWHFPAGDTDLWLRIELPSVRK